MCSADVEAVDIGNYKCASGYTGEVKNDSNTVELLVNPDVQSTSLDLTTTAPNVDDSYLFNSSYSITCEGVAPSTSTTLGLTVKTQDDTEITQDFELTINKEWVGNVEGLKYPLVTYKLEAMDWSLETSKSDEIFCYFQDGDRLLHSKSIEVYKMEDEPVVNCTSNYKQRAVKADDEDVYITCRVYKYTGSLENTDLSWNFVNEETGQNSTLVAGDSTDPQRIVKAELDLIQVTMEIATQFQLVFRF
ncbi:hypothetical protein EB796_015621 [Bugula neritina]|uniref:Uncharacterized protein n=1 Tax=Bugula neritina TaxID=10212 RepID=A0A7J7JJT9_BUGNE|nr:hypothetical protein EB796_015621 [Bugula neritina]